MTRDNGKRANEETKGVWEGKRSLSGSHFERRAGVNSRRGARVPVPEEWDDRGARVATNLDSEDVRRWEPVHECPSAGRPVGSFRPTPVVVRFGEDVRRVVQDGEARGPRRGVQRPGRPRVFARAGQKGQRGAVAATRGDAFGLVDTGTSHVGSHQISKDSAPSSFTFVYFEYSRTSRAFEDATDRTTVHGRTRDRSPSLRRLLGARAAR